MTNRTLVVSIDALITADIPVLRQLPNLGACDGARLLDYGYRMYLSHLNLSLPCHYCHRLLAGPDWHQQ